MCSLICSFCMRAGSLFFFFYHWLLWHKSPIDLHNHAHIHRSLPLNWAFDRLHFSWFPLVVQSGIMMKCKWSSPESTASHAHSWRRIFCRCGGKKNETVIVFMKINEERGCDWSRRSLRSCPDAEGATNSLPVRNKSWYLWRDPCPFNTCLWTFYFGFNFQAGV